MTALQIKALRYGIQIIKSTYIPSPNSVEGYDDKARMKAFEDRMEANNLITKGLDWIEAACIDGEKVIKTNSND